MNEEQEAMLQRARWQQEREAKALAAIEAGITKEDFLMTQLDLYRQAWDKVMNRLEKEN